MSEKMIRKTSVMGVIRSHMEGENNNTKAVLSDVMESVNELETLSQEPTSEMVHVETLHQVMWERDIAIEQLHELGYEFGQKIEPCDDAISRDKVKKWICKTCPDDSECQRDCDVIKGIDALPTVTQKSETVTEFADRCRECGKMRKGHWIETEYHRWRCSVCREKGMSEWDNIHNVRTNFCPNCGAKMVEPRESEGV